MTSTDDKSILWTPIEPPSTDDRAIDVSEFQSISAVWADTRKTLDGERATALAEFNARLRRSWSIETGILENLYVVDRSTTQTLIDKGFHQELIDRSSSDTDPGLLVLILKDNLAASDMINALLEDGRPLTAHFIREIQAAITQHQATVSATDHLGNAVETPVLKGQWKTLQNYRFLPDGRQLYYCPPEQVEGQIDDLLTYLRLLDEEKAINIAILAAWFHHRFTYIHPFQDANGRVARALVNYVFVRAGLFPVVVDRDRKVRYIEALEAADGGDLAPFVNLLAAEQIKSVTQALSLAEGSGEPQSTLVKELGRGIVNRVRVRREHEQAQFRDVDKVVDALAESAVKFIGAELDDFAAELSSGDLESVVNVDFGGTFDGRGHYYKWEVVESANQAGKWANFDENVRWVRALVRREGTQLRVVFSFHHVGRRLSGIAEVTSIADLTEVEATDESHGPSDRASFNCMVQPFSFTWRDNAAELEGRFEEWVRTCLITALKEWADRI